jgi:hypothetical protein
MHLNLRCIIMIIRSIIASLFLIALGATTAAAAPTGSSGAAAIARVVGGCGNPCIVAGNNGGRIVDFERAASAIRSSHRMLVIDGFCASACMTMADRARPRACITPNAVFAYHKTNWNRPIPLGAGPRKWIMRHGGFPNFGATPGIMPNRVARQFWPLCKDTAAQFSRL